MFSIMLSQCCKRHRLLQIRYRALSQYSPPVPTAQRTEPVDYSKLIRKVNSLGHTKLKETAEIIENVPIGPLIKAVIQQIKDSSKESGGSLIGTNSYSDRSRDNSSNAFTLITDSLISIKSSKVNDIINQSKTDIVVANLLGANRLLRACNMLLNISFNKE